MNVFTPKGIITTFGSEDKNNTYFNGEKKVIEINSSYSKMRMFSWQTFFKSVKLITYRKKTMPIFPVRTRMARIT